jgi:hypothetical protein
MNATPAKILARIEIETSAYPYDDPRAIVVLLHDLPAEQHEHGSRYYQVTVTGATRFTGSTGPIHLLDRAWERFNRTVDAIRALTEDGFDLMRGADEE